MILDEILAHKRREIAQAKLRLPLEALWRRVKGRRAARSFRQALVRPRPALALIAELKRTSPSRGVLRERFDPVSLAQQMQEAGASALSVLTDEKFFGGSLEILRDVHQFTEIPTLRKDFILDPYQIYEALEAQADAVLLIVQALTVQQLVELLQAAGTVGMDAVVEVHAESELDTALEAGAGIIGINHRDLRTFTMDMTLVERLTPQIPDGKIVIAESGVQTPQDLQRMKAFGVHAVLIGEALMTAPDVGAKIRELLTGF